MVIWERKCEKAGVGKIMKRKEKVEGDNERRGRKMEGDKKKKGRCKNAGGKWKRN